MSAYDFYKAKLNVDTSSTGKKYITLGAKLKNDSDMLMNRLWDNDITAKQCYIYDYFHDNQPQLNVGMTYENTTKTPIDAKILITSYGSISKDQPELHVMFRPNQKFFFNEDDELYYLEEYRKLYQNEVPVGCYLDAPDKDGVYHKYLICLHDIRNNQFQKYFILPCDYNLEWIRNENGKRIKQRMWGVLKSQSSYNSGLWVDEFIATRENQEILFLPSNSISDTIWYLSNDNKSNQRLIVDIPCDNPNVWQVSKIERVNVRGRTRITLYQTEFNEHTDYVEKDNDGKIIGMWADYYTSTVIPDETPNQTDDTVSEKSCNLSSDATIIRLGGSYQNITLLYMENGVEITDYSSISTEWKCFVDDIDITDSEYVVWSTKVENNEAKIKLKQNYDYIGKILTVQCSVNDTVGKIQFEMLLT